METTRNKIPPRTQHFFNSLSNYLDTKLYYFGSIQRADYFPQGSDIDVDIFTDNEQATMIQMQHFLQLWSIQSPTSRRLISHKGNGYQAIEKAEGVKVSKKDFKRFVWRLNTNDRLVYGHKIMYKDPEGEFAAEFSIYNTKVKDWILNEHQLKTFLPFYTTCILVILKYLYYTLGVIPSSWYTYMKRFTLSTLSGFKYDEFVVIDLKSTFGKVISESGEQNKPLQNLEKL